MSWRIRGTYFESCNCDPICPCRRIDGVSGGRSTLVTDELVVEDEELSFGFRGVCGCGSTFDYAG